jgi:hypothetical protein
MIDFRYLQTGIYGLANAHRAGTMAGHLGAAVVTGYFIGEDQGGLPDEVYRGIEGELKRVIAGEATAERSRWVGSRAGGAAAAPRTHATPQHFVWRRHNGEFSSLGRPPRS